MSERFSRTEMLLGPAAMELLSQAHVAVFGLGGVGGSCAEALARAGIGQLTLVDNGRVEESNLNRQVIATGNVVGMPKVEVAAARIALINPDCKVNALDCFYLPDTADQIDLASIDYVVDAVDTLTAKLLLIEKSHEAGVPIVSSMGAGNRLDPTAFQVADIYETSICPLAKRIRKECRKRGIEQLKVVYSTEPALEPEGGEEPPPGRNTLPGSVSFVPPVAGYILAGEAVRDLAGIKLSGT